MPDWVREIRARCAALSLHCPDDVVDEIGEHAEALFQRRRAEGASHDEALAAVEAELGGLPALVRARAVRRRERARSHADPPPGGVGGVRAFASVLRYAARLLAAR